MGNITFLLCRVRCLKFRLRKLNVVLVNSSVNQLLIFYSTSFSFFIEVYAWLEMQVNKFFLDVELCIGWLRLGSTASLNLLLPLRQFADKRCNQFVAPESCFLLLIQVQLFANAFKRPLSRFGYSTQQVVGRCLGSILQQ